MTLTWPVTDLVALSDDALDTSFSTDHRDRTHVGVTVDRASASRDESADLVARCVIAGLFLGLTYRIGLSAIETGRLSGLLLLTSELLVVVLTLVRRHATSVDRRSWARVVAGVSIVGPFLLRPVGAVGIAEESWVLAGSVLGLIFVIAGKVSLGRSLGLLPANRGVVCNGAYRLVRHPMYLGYLLIHVAFLLGHVSTWNVAVLVAADLALCLRVGLEERTLLPDPAYRRYKAAVPWRLIPRVY